MVANGCKAGVTALVPLKPVVVVVVVVEMWVGEWGEQNGPDTLHCYLPILPLRSAFSLVAWMRRRRLVGKSPPPVLLPVD